MTAGHASLSLSRIDATVLSVESETGEAAARRE